MATLNTLENDFPYSKAESWKMFNRISRRYDFLNRFLSFGLDISWRKKLAFFLPQKSNLEILDLATGTGDVLIYLCRRAKNIRAAYGIDMADKMLDVGHKKIKRNGLNDKITLKKGDANQIPFEEDSFDAVTIAFGIRNMTEPKHVLKEMGRVLKKGGRALILEFSIPRNTLIRAIHLFYLRKILPKVGAVISGDLKAYQYLNQTVEAFPYGEEFCQMMRDVGFRNVKANALTFGTAMIYEGTKP